MAKNLESIADNSLMLEVKSGDLNKLGLLYKKYVWIKGTFNGGGPEYLFTNFNGDIIIKKK